MSANISIPGGAWLYPFGFHNKNTSLSEASPSALNRMKILGYIPVISFFVGALFFIFTLEELQNKKKQLLETQDQSEIHIINERNKVLKMHIIRSVIEILQLGIFLLIVDNLCLYVTSL